MVIEKRSVVGKFTKLAAYALLYLILVGVIVYSANPSIPADSDAFNMQNKGYTSLVSSMIIALAIMTFAISLIYMASGFFDKQDWRMQMKEEVYQLLMSVLWAVFIFSVAVVVDNLVTMHAVEIAGFGGPGANSFTIAENYLDKITCVSSMTTLKLEGLKMGAQYLAGMRSRYYASAWGFSMPTFPGFEVIERGIETTQILITPFTASLFVQIIGLQIVHATAFTVILPAGLLLRIFPMTRDAGSFLMAAAFAFYFILPFTYLINAAIMTQLYQNEFGYAMCTGGDEVDSKYFVQKGDFFDSLFVQMLPKFNEDFFSFPSHLSYVAFQAVFLPSMNMVLVVTFIRATLKFFSQKMG
jgi:hypothetical protein